MHCQSLPGVPSHHRDIDVIIIRENTEGEYRSLEHEVCVWVSYSLRTPGTEHTFLKFKSSYFQNVSGVVESLKIITRVNSLRIAEYAFNLAREKGHHKVTAVHKANIM